VRGILRGFSSHCGERPRNAGKPTSALHPTTMNWFKALFGTNDTPETSERLDILETKFRRLQEEWSDVYGKFRTMQMRVAKQIERANESPNGEPQAGGGEEAISSAGSTSSLSPRAQKIQNEILARRRRGGVIPTEGGE